ncbi:hypothetical protein D9M72_193320 [compost metagenome]
MHLRLDAQRLRNAALVARQHDVAVGLVAQDGSVIALALATQAQPRDLPAGGEVQGHVVALHERTGVHRRQLQDDHLAGSQQFFALPDPAVGHRQHQRQAAQDGQRAPAQRARHRRQRPAGGGRLRAHQARHQPHQAPQEEEQHRGAAQPQRLLQQRHVELVVIDAQVGQQTEHAENGQARLVQAETQQQPGQGEAHARAGQPEQGQDQQRQRDAPGHARRQHAAARPQHRQGRGRGKHGAGRHQHRRPGVELPHRRQLLGRNAAGQPHHALDRQEESPGQRL